MKYPRSKLLEDHGRDTWLLALGYFLLSLTSWSPGWVVIAGVVIKVALDTIAWKLQGREGLWVTIRPGGEGPSRLELVDYLQAVKASPPKTIGEAMRAARAAMAGLHHDQQKAVLEDLTEGGKGAIDRWVDRYYEAIEGSPEGEKPCGTR